MSAGNLIGTIFVCVVFSAMWVVLGAAVDKIGLIFNHTIQLLPSFQDAANGMTLMQTVWIVIPILVWIVLWINYAVNEANEAGGLV